METLAHETLLRGPGFLKIRRKAVTGLVLSTDEIPQMRWAPLQKRTSLSLEYCVRYHLRYESGDGRSCDLSLCVEVSAPSLLEDCVLRSSFPCRLRKSPKVEISVGEVRRQIYCGN